MTRHDFIHKKFPLICLVLALALFVLSMTDISSPGSLAEKVEETEENVRERISALNSQISKTLSVDPSVKSSPAEIDNDLVIYRYVNDSLIFWNNQFPILNDDISRKLVFHRLSPFDNRVESPLADVTDQLTYMNIGTKWYLIKYVDGTWNDRVIAGIEIKNTLTEESCNSDNGVNPELDLSNQYGVEPLNYNGGLAVTIDGVPLFKITLDASQHSAIIDNCTLRWIAILIFTLATVLFLAGHRTFKVYFTVVPILCALAITAYFWSESLSGSHQIFSPSIFSDDTFSSLGILLLANAFIFTISICTFIIRGRITGFINKDRKTAKVKALIYGIFIIASLVAISLYIHHTLRSFIINSNVSLELYKASDNIFYTVIVYISYTLLLACIPFLLQELKPTIWEFTGRRFEIITRRNLIIFAFICAAYFTALSAILGLEKEKEKVASWARSITDDRSPQLENTLNEIEEQIADDQNIASFITQEYGASIILNRIREHYLIEYNDTYDMDVTIIQDRDRLGQALFSEIILNGTPVTNGEKFLFLYDKQGHGKYAGVFLFFRPGAGTSRMIIEIEPKINKEGRGYNNILTHFKKSPDINIPQIYSYAKYKEGHLTTYNGTFPYPNVSNIYASRLSNDNGNSIYRTEDHVHFIIRTGKDEIVVLSRPQRTVLLYFTSLSYLFLAMTLLSLLIPTRKKAIKTFRSNYFRTRISVIIFVSSFLLLSCMAFVSITFVYDRNEQNMFDMMKSRVNTIQGMFESRIRTANSWQDMKKTSFTSLLNEIGNNTKSDISLYTPEGKIFISTTPEIFENRILGSRINTEAFHNIQSRSKRFYIMEEETGGYEYWTIYAPLINDKGKIIAIMAVPYTDTDYDFMKESFFHAAIIINVFILLLVISLIVTNRIINSMFTPLVEMGKKMSGGSVNNLEYIIYKRDDEISSLVDAYNRMVKDLSDSTRQLAQAERDNAWSQMARQVAHEIKNPLTPIKLEIQRLIRLKQNGNPKWEEKFDQVTSVVLEHIQILSETANEFSTFAKLYTEEPVLVNLDKTLQDQILIFDNKENIQISYMGLDNASAMAPKPQLIRVFVNLITNAIQAVEIQQKEAVEKGETPPQGHVLICLRHGTKDGFYDITFEDNGPGVKGENLDKLFTPNFTTKTGGTGLGLAICRNIIEKCDGEISYQKSFSLGGACFVVSIPNTQKL
jgi:signal transduction histidine kinase